MEKTNSILQDNLDMEPEAFRMAGGLPQQCRQCRYWIKNDALHCEKFKILKKPKFVLWAQRKCPRFSAMDY